MILELRNIEKYFGEKHVLKGISFKAESGKAFGLLGRNGAGKTTTIRILMNVYAMNSGEILIDNKPIDHTKIGIGYLPEERGLYQKKKVAEQLIYFSRLKGMSRWDAANSVDYWLQRLEMSDYADKRLNVLSKGNQQKIQLVTALAHDPDIVILDEPFSGLDPVNARLLKDVVKEIIEKGKIVLFSSHQMSYIEEFCDSIAIINAGKIAVSGDLNEIKHNYPRNKLVLRTRDSDRVCKELPELTSLQKNGDIILTLDSPNDKMDMIMKLSSKFDIDEIRVLEPSLNDIFVEYAGERDDY